MQLPLRRLAAVAAVAVGVLGSAAPAFAAAGQPTAGSVGRADGRTPAGQAVNDHNRGYGCDDNLGAGRGNPAHSPCSTSESFSS